MTSGSATLASGPRRGGPAGELGLEQSPDLVVAQAARAQPLDGRRDQRLAGAQVVGRLLGARAGGDERAGAVTQLDHALVLELAIGLGHGVGIDHELLRQWADARQLLPRPK